MVSAQTGTHTRTDIGCLLRGGPPGSLRIHGDGCPTGSDNGSSYLGSAGVGGQVDGTDGLRFRMLSILRPDSSRHFHPQSAPKPRCLCVMLAAPSNTTAALPG